MLLKKLGNYETKLLSYDTIDKEVKAPVYICGLARSGSTIILEILNSHQNLTSYQYKDYPFVHFANFWDFANKFIPHSGKKRERAHKDRLAINFESPEALEEILWMSFFENLHNPAQINTLSKDDLGSTSFPDFYKDAIKKLLFMRKAKRYIAKNNAAVGRLDYIKSLFPDARFIIPIRKPEEHIYSLLKQHRLISAEQQKDERGARYMRRHGHFEFGLDFRPLNFGNHDTTNRILELWNEGHIIAAYALYWHDTYSFLWNQIQSDPDLARVCMIVPYDKLCANSEKEIQEILAFCDLDDAGITQQWAPKISQPDYYSVDFTDGEKATIADLTRETERLYWPEIINGEKTA